MNKSTFIILGLAAVLTVACSKKHAPEQPQTPVIEQEEWVSNESLPVPISIGQNTLDAALTKAAPITDENIGGTLFGVFGVDLEADGAWSETAEQVLLYDKYAKFEADKMQFVEATGDVQYYYPLITRFNYTFYGFHTSSETDFTAYKNDFNGTFEGDALYTEIPLGRTDILWAKASATDITGKLKEEDAVETTLKGFNAKYARYSRRWYPGTYTDYQPLLTYQHLTSALHFYAVAEDEEAYNTLNGKVTVKNLSVIGIPTTAKLCIASKSAEGEGVLEPLVPATATDSLKMHNLAGVTDGLGVTPTTGAGTEIGEGMFIIPQTAAGIEVSFTLTSPNGDVYFKDSIPVPQGGSFEAGKFYNFKILVRSLEEIVINADLSGWNQGAFDDNQVADIG